MKSVFVLWNSVLDFSNEINKFLNNEFYVEKTNYINLEQYYSQFVNDLYYSEKMEPSKIEAKLLTMLKYPQRAIVYNIVNIEKPTDIFNQYKKRYVCKEIENAKQYLRETYRTKVPFYTFDTVIHASDDEIEYQNNNRIISLYEDLTR
ncbi:MAG: hypothetical protein J5580_02590 [Clostridia bacterium]|nr:hypothetical protein [Clostridia bacterium]